MSKFLPCSIFLQTPPYHFGSAVVSLFGVVGAVAAPQVGRLADRTGNPRLTIGPGLSIVLLAFGVFWFLGTILWGLIIGVIKVSAPLPSDKWSL
jgi:MFS family permease